MRTTILALFLVLRIHEWGGMIYTFDEAGWVTAPPASEITAAYGYHSAPVALTLAGTGFPVPDGAGIAVPTLVVGTHYAIYAWVMPNLADDAYPLRISIGLPNEETFVFETYKSTLLPGWQRVFVGEFTAWRSGFFDDDQRLLRANLAFPGMVGYTPTGRWGVDDISIEESSEVDMRKWDAINAAVNVLKTITTAGNYNNDLGSRVYTRWFTPATRGDVKLPYACLPVDQEAETIEYEGFQFRSTFNLTGQAFFSDNSESDPLNSTGATAAAKFRDDLIRAFMADQHLGGKAQNCEVTDIETSAGIIEDGVSEVVFTVSFMQYGGASDLTAA